MKRTPLKRGDSVLKKTDYIRKGKPLKKWSIGTKLRLANGDKEVLEQNVFFENIWKPLLPYQRKCYETGELLLPDENGNPLTVYFHHVLAKELYPQFRFSPWNIVLVSLSTHSQLHTSQRLCPKIHELYLHFMSKIHTLDP